MRGAILILAAGLCAGLGCGPRINAGEAAEEAEVPREVAPGHIAGKGRGKESAMDEQLFFEDDFSAGLGEWVWEADGDSQAKVEDGQLTIKPGRRSYGGVNVWCRRRIPADFRLEFDYVPIEETGNLVFIFAAGQLDGKDLIAGHAGRNGHYVWITNREQAFRWKTEFLQGRRVPPMACYTISYWFPVEQYPDANRLPVRKNPGHLLLGDAQRPVPEDERLRPHHFTIAKRGGRITFFRDGEKVHDIEDEGGQKVQAITRHQDGTLEKKQYVMPIYGEGDVGLRSLNAHAACDNVRVFVPSAGGRAPDDL